MNDVITLALEISSKHVFSVFDNSAVAIGECEGAAASACKNHLDDDFMAQLANGEHLRFNNLAG